MAEVLLRGINKIYPPDVTAVSDFNLEIKDKEFVVFVGPSGCGKSTTLRMIAGLEQITSGDLLIDGVRVNDQPPKNRDIAMVFQNYALYPHMTVYDNMAFGLKLKKYSRSEIQKKVQEASRILDIEHLLKRKPRALSGGQRQRVALGRAIVREPKVFLLDEPLSNLDAKLRGQMRTELSKLHKRLETTFIYVTHDQVEAMTMGDRIVVMKDGFIQQVDTPSKLYDEPANVFVAGFIGMPQMNFFTARLQKKEDGHVYLVFGQDGAYQMALPDGKVNAAVRGRLDREVIVGLRPENIHDEEIFLSTFPLGKLTCTVEMAEMMGAETYLHLSAKGLSLVARVSSRTNAQVEDQVTVMFDPGRVHLFDKETERSLYLESDG